MLLVFLTFLILEEQRITQLLRFNSQVIAPKLSSKTSECFSSFGSIFLMKAINMSKKNPLQFLPSSGMFTDSEKLSA